MLQSIFSADFDFDRFLLTLSSSSSSASAKQQQQQPPIQPDSKSSDSGLPLDEDPTCAWDYSTEPSSLSDAAPLSLSQGRQQVQQPELRLITRGSPGSGSDLVILNSRCQEPLRDQLDIRTAHIILNYMEQYLTDRSKLQLEWNQLEAAAARHRGADDCSDPASQASSENQLSESHRGSVQDMNSSRVGDCFCCRPARRLAAAAGHVVLATAQQQQQQQQQSQKPETDGRQLFWRLLWQCDATALVNLDGPAGGDEDIAAAGRYWPTRGSQVYGDFEVHLVSEHVCCDEFVIRSLRVRRRRHDASGSNENNGRWGPARTVTQFHYTGWDEHGLPSRVASLLEFRRKVNRSYRSVTSPIVVHCSDGLGRSGLYCLLDVALNRIGSGVREIDLAATLEHLRDQRPRLVTSLEQFEFVFAAVAEEVEAILRTLSS